MDDLETQITILEENIDPQTQEAMDRFYAAYKKTYELPKDIKMLPRLLQLLKRPCNSIDSDTLKMDIVTYIEEFDSVNRVHVIAADAANLVRDAYEWSAHLFLGVLMFADQRATMKRVFLHLSDENKVAITRMFNDIIFGKELSFGFSETRQAEMSRFAQEAKDES